MYMYTVFIQQMLDDLLNFFVQKVTDIRTQIVPGSFNPPFTVCSSAIFNQFSPRSLQSLSKINVQMKLTYCCYDNISSKIIKQTLEIIGPSLLTLIKVI